MWHQDVAVAACQEQSSSCSHLLQASTGSRVPQELEEGSCTAARGTGRGSLHFTPAEELASHQMARLDHVSSVSRQRSLCQVAQQTSTACPTWSSSILSPSSSNVTGPGSSEPAGIPALMLTVWILICTIKHSRYMGCRCNTNLHGEGSCVPAQATERRSAETHASTGAVRQPPQVSPL